MCFCFCFLRFIFCFCFSSFFPELCFPAVLSCVSCSCDLCLCFVRAFSGRGEGGVKRALDSQGVVRREGEGGG